MYFYLLFNDLDLVFLVVHFRSDLETTETCLDTGGCFILSLQDYGRLSLQYVKATQE